MQAPFGVSKSTLDREFLQGPEWNGDRVDWFLEQTYSGTNRVRELMWGAVVVEGEIEILRTRERARYRSWIESEF